MMGLCEGPCDKVFTYLNPGIMSVTKVRKWGQSEHDIFRDRKMNVCMATPYRMLGSAFHKMGSPFQGSLHIFATSMSVGLGIQTLRAFSPARIALRNQHITFLYS